MPSSEGLEPSQNDEKSQKGRAALASLVGRGGLDGGALLWSGQMSPSEGDCLRRGGSGVCKDGAFVNKSDRRDREMKSKSLLGCLHGFFRPSTRIVFLFPTIHSVVKIVRLS